MNFKHVVFALGANLFAALSAQAAIVGPSTSVTASFDVSGVTPGQITAWGYRCSTTCAGDTNLFDSGAQVLANFGTSAGADDIGSVLFTQPFGFDISNFNTPNGTPIAVGSISTLFLTFIYVDDTFGVDSLRITFGDQNFSVNAVQLDGTVPLPAALPLFLAGLAGVRVASRRRKQAAA